MLTGSSASWRTAVMTVESAVMTDDDAGTDDCGDGSGNDAGDCVVDNASLYSVGVRLGAMKSSDCADVPCAAKCFKGSKY